MNALLNAPPKRVRIGAFEYDINTDYRAAIEFELATENDEQDVEKLIRPFFPGGIPNDIAGAVDAVLWFFRCGADEPTDDEKAKPKSNRQSYSFSVDADAIFADFWRFYDIDLSQEGLHWWTFRALLLGLPEDSDFKQRVYYRTCDLKGLPKKEVERINKIREAIKIETKTGGKKTLAERNAQMREYVKRRAKSATRGGINHAERRKSRNQYRG